MYSSRTFAGGCFWCMVKPFDELPGILSVVSGYTGGHTVNPTYEEVCTETTGHAEAVQITFEPELFRTRGSLSFTGSKLIRLIGAVSFWIAVTRTRTAIFVHNEQQASTGGSLEEGAQSKRQVQRTNRDGNCNRRPLLSGRGLSPALL